MPNLEELTDEEIDSLQNLGRIPILVLTSGQKDPVLHCEAILLEHYGDEGVQVLSFSHCTRSMTQSYLVPRKGIDNLVRVSYTEQSIVRYIGADRDYGYKAILKYEGESSIPVPDTI